MKIIKKINDYLNDREYRIVTSDNYVNIANYTKILDFDSNQIDVEYNSKIISIKGNGLVIKKMLDQELLIIGNIDTVTYR